VRAEQVAAGTWDGSIRVLDIERKEEILRLPGPALILAMSSGGHTLLTSSNDRTLRLWRPSDEPVSPLLERRAVSAVAFGDDQSLLALAGDREDPTVHVVELALPERPRTALPGRKGISVRALALHGDKVVSGESDGMVRIHDVTHSGSAVELRGFPDPTHRVRSLAVHGDRAGRMRIALASDQGEVRLIAPGVSANTADLVGKGARLVTFSRDGNLLAGAGDAEPVVVWDLSGPQARQLYALKGQAGAIVAVTFAPDRRRLAAVWKDTVGVWNLDQPGAPVWKRDAPHAVSIAFDQAGVRLAVGHLDGVVRVWHPGNDDLPPVTLGSHGGWEVKALAFRPSDDRFISVDQYSRIRLWAPARALADGVCNKVTRNLRQDEWKQYLGTERTREKTCPAFP
jgi:WD40 repeat protein